MPALGAAPVAVAVSWVPWEMKVSLPLEAGAAPVSGADVKPNAARGALAAPDWLRVTLVPWGLPAAALQKSVAEYNASLTGKDERAPMRSGPYYALGPAISWIVFSEGGLKVDTKLRALDRTGKPIPGLYAAGSAGQGGVILEGHGHHLGWGFTSGRLAGANAARE